MQEKNSPGDKIVGINIAQRIEEKGLTQKKFAELVGISQGYLSEIIKGTKTPRKRISRKIEEELGKKSYEKGILSSDFTLISLYGVEGSGGPGRVVESEEVVDVLAFKTSWIKTELRANREDLFLIFMVGDSMEPTLRPGDIILIDKRENPIHRDGVYVFRMGESLQVKRLQCFPDKTIEATADNSVYKSFKIEPEKMAESFRVIGRVVWAGRRM